MPKLFCTNQWYSSIGVQRRVLQMRVDMGILQLETEGRPDGNRFQGAITYFEYLQRMHSESPEFELDEDRCLEIDREFVQFYHRRVCWLQLKEFKRAVEDADHTLGLMDFCKTHSPDEQWTISHEQYRPFVLYHRRRSQRRSDTPQNVVRRIRRRRAIWRRRIGPAPDGIPRGLARKVWCGHDAQRTAWERCQ